MHEVYDKWHIISRDSYNYDHEQIEFTEIDHIVFTGMGGSGTIGDVFSSILSKTNIHVSVVRGYLLPNTVDSNSLIVNTSISGNTVETLNILDSAKKKNCKVIAISSGGKMEDYCKKYNVNFRKIPQYHSPRASFAGFMYSLLKILGPILPIKQVEIKESITELSKLQSRIHSGNLLDDNLSLNLAHKINGIPLIYYPHGLNAAATRFKNSLQENAKLHSMVEDVVETCHNGLVGWERPSSIKPILLQGDDDFIKTKERWKIIKEYFQEKNIEYDEIHSLKGNILTKLICLIYQLDYSTIYCAAISKIDPSPIHAIDFVKQRL
jgi:glucose/mannose-6-phosphate isomerase|tara:strand:- start:1405 stop:2373 length:969 start_codon:yes stop_codon:yes gene_type:complete